MKKSALKQILKIPDAEFNLENTLMNGQCFNWTKNESLFKGVWRQYAITLERTDLASLEFEAQPPMPQKVLENEFLGSYLRYPSISVTELYAKWEKMDPKFFAKVGPSLPGVRTLRQDPWECLISFILSSNNNIKRIQSLVVKLRQEFGEPIANSEGEHSFPSIEALLKANE